MGGVRDDAPKVHPETAEDWRAWLDAHHDREDGVWLVSWRTPTGRPRVGTARAVEEALSFGWIDSKQMVIDEERSQLWFCPRRRGSGWSRVNKERIARLEADGRMTDAGRAAIDAAKADGSWTSLDEVEDLVVPDDLAAALDGHPGARERWEDLPRSSKKRSLGWIVQAKRPETRARRVEQVAAKVAAGERPP